MRLRKWPDELLLKMSPKTCTFLSLKNIYNAYNLPISNKFISTAHAGSFLGVNFDDKSALCSHINISVKSLSMALEIFCKNLTRCF